MNRSKVYRYTNVINLYIAKKNSALLGAISDMAVNAGVSRSEIIMRILREKVEAVRTEQGLKNSKNVDDYGYPISEAPVKQHSVKAPAAAAEQQPIDDELKQMLGL